jgi:hypothetical protein
MAQILLVNNATVKIQYRLAEFLKIIGGKFIIIHITAINRRNL